MFERIIFIITIIGTDKSIQTTHQIIHQNQREITITSELKLSLFHISFGSITFEIKSSIIIKAIKSQSNQYQNHKIIKAKTSGSQKAKKDQTFGIKFRTKIKKDQNKAKSIEKIFKTK